MFMIETDIQEIKIHKLPEAISMIPLVKQIIGSYLDAVQQREINFAQANALHIKNRREKLSWAERQLMYGYDEAIKSHENEANNCADELMSLSVLLIDPKVGRIGFPTIVNGLMAVFSWSPGLDSILQWHYVEKNTKLRDIPKEWYTTEL